MENLDSVAVMGFVLSFATLAELQNKGVLSRTEVRKIIDKSRFALEIEKLDKSPNLQAAYAIVKLLVTPIPGEETAPDSGA